MNPVQIEQLLALLPELEQLLLAQRNCLVEDPEWPEAIPSDLLCTTEEDKYSRAESLLDIMPLDVFGQKFLDFGCGEGHVVTKAPAALSLGYDIQPTGNLWDTDSRLTTDFKKIQQAAPFDIIMLYDVLDHAKNPVAVLQSLKSLSAQHTRIFLRCHPWCGRHGGHGYRRWNKAFVHLILKDLQDVDLPIQRVVHPINTYKGWIASADLTVERHYEETQPVEDFFKKSPYREALLKHWKTSPDPALRTGTSFPEYQMSQSYQTYILKI